MIKFKFLSGETILSPQTLQNTVNELTSVITLRRTISEDLRESIKIVKLKGEQSIETSLRTPQIENIGYIPYSYFNYSPEQFDPHIVNLQPGTNFLTSKIITPIQDPLYFSFGQNSLLFIGHTATHLNQIVLIPLRNEHLTITLHQKNYKIIVK